MSLFKCRGKDCGFSTDNVEDYVEHRIQEVLKETKPTEEKPKPRHRTIDEAIGFLNCPECRKSFVEAAKRDPKFLEEIKPEPTAEEKKRKGFLH